LVAAPLVRGIVLLVFEVFVRPQHDPRRRVKIPA
jgi:hypothetical protein